MLYDLRSDNKPTLARFFAILTSNEVVQVIMRGAAKKERKNERGSSRPPLQRKKKNFFTPANKVNKSNQKIIRSIQTIKVQRQERTPGFYAFFRPKVNSAHT